MPALHLFGRKWLAATDDLVFPGLFEFALRLLWLSLLACATSRYYHLTYECTTGGSFVRFYLIGMLTLLVIVMIVIVIMVNRSAQGAITDTLARKHVPFIIAIKVILLIPEIALNIMGTILAFSNLVDCNLEKFTCHVIEGLVLFDWGLFALTVFGLAFVFDPIGSLTYYDKWNNSDINVESLKHRKISRLWMKRFRWFFCWVRKDKHCHEAFQQVASLLSTLFRGTDLVPSDIVAGCVLLRVKQKRKTRELRRIQLLSSEKQPRASSDVREVFATVPKWMCLHKARHFLKLSVAAYGWPYVLYRYCATGICRILPHTVCCSCIRRKSTFVTDDNCCLCNLAGVKYTSELSEDDILFATFRNHIFELPFCVIADHRTGSIVIAIRGSISLRDVFTDLTACSEKFEAEGVPPDTMAHKGMIAGAKYIKARLDETGILDKAFTMYPHYDLVLTGHSLGAGVAALLAFHLRPVYPRLKVYGFATPAALLSREAAKLTESFMFTVGVGDDFVMRLSVESVENLRCKILQVLSACRLPKYRIIINGCGYAFFGVPSRDLESTWREDMSTAPPTTTGQFPLLYDPYHNHASDTTPEASLLARDVTLRRFSRTKLYTAGKILHITHRKKTKAERKTGTGGPSFEMRWSSPEDFTELKIEPRMLLDHLPENVHKVLETVLSEQRLDISDPFHRSNKISIL